MVKKTTQLSLENKVLIIRGELTHQTVPDIKKQLRHYKKKSAQSIDLKDLTYTDSSGVVFLDWLSSEMFPGIPLLNAGDKVQKALENFSSRDLKIPHPPRPSGFFESMGNAALTLKNNVADILYLTSEIMLWSFYGIFISKGRRKGAVAHQILLIGSNAVGIVGLLSIVIGLIIALQSAAQLRQYGAGIYVADLIAISMVREMGPMMTAIIIAGRSGSAFAAEISTMKVTEELDALKMMALNPIRYVVVPKFLAITICMPLLVMISIILGILGGFIIGLTYLDLTYASYFNQTLSILEVKDLLIGLSKSVFFAWVIVIISSFFGFKAEGGAEGVGIVTTSSVVASIFAVIVLNALFSLIYM
ncbi:MAG TPA: MlaE family lipid ABC transporter permease subunit [Candidatus Marinimicrobia bacterium]|nr:MlaE family lipid ABC transporter permease subunit [Candidatus Neomarinimicrobiota bacterium]